MKPAIFGRSTMTFLLILAGVSISFHCVVADESEDRYWRALTSPESALSGFVNCLIVFNGELIAAGGFATAGEDTLNSIARWDGTKWRALGNGTNRPISCLAAYNEELIAGGEFTMAGGISANGIARWNGSQWLPLESGVRGVTEGEWFHVAAMVEYDGRLIVGGRFSYAGNARIQDLASWDGSTWREVPHGFSGDIHALTIFKGQLIAVGEVSEPIAGTVVMQFDGIDKWSVIGNCDPETEVNALLGYRDNLIAGGTFARIGEVEAARIASWGGTGWKPLGAGFGQSIWCLSMSNGNVIAAGAGGAIASWDGTNWVSLGTGADGDINACLEFDGKLIVAGAFRSAGQIRAGHIAVWDKPSSLAKENDK